MIFDKKLSKPVDELDSHLNRLLKNFFCHPELVSGSPDVLNSLDAETSSA